MDCTRIVMTTAFAILTLVPAVSPVRAAHSPVGTAEGTWAESGAAQPPREAADSSATARIEALLRRHIRAEEPGVACVVVHEGQTVYRNAIGMADLAQGLPLEPGHLFAIGSMTKPLTAAGVMTLVEEGRVSLDDVLTDYLPDYPSGDLIHVRDLLTHTSGIRRLHSLDRYWERIEDDLTLTELIEFFRDEPLEFEPSTKWTYCNSGYYLLELLIEEITGQTWEEFLTERVLTPAGMTHTVCATGRDVVPGMARGYSKVKGQWAQAREMSYTHLRAAGGLITSLDDMVRFSEALFGGRLLDRESLGLVFRPAPLKGSGTASYGLGWFVDDLGGRPMVYHGGGIFGYVAHMLFLPRERLFVALLSNREDRHADPGMQRLAEVVALETLGPTEGVTEHKAIEVAPDILNRYAGDYRIADGPSAGTIRSIILEDGSLYYDQGGGRRAHMLAKAEGVFFFEGKKSIITFETDAEGSVTQMILHQGGMGGRRIVFERVAGEGG